MAYSINKSPAQYQPAYNDVIFIVEDVLINSRENYKYIADVTLYNMSDLASSGTVRLKCFPDPKYGVGVFNIGRILETAVYSDITADAGVDGFNSNDNSFAKYSVSFGEEYGASSGVVVYPDLINSGIKYVWNGVVPFLNFMEYFQNNYTSVNTALNYTNSELIRKIELGQDAWLYFINDDVLNYTEARISVYDIYNNVIRECTVPNPFKSAVGDSDHFIRFGTGTANLNIITAQIDVVGTGSIIGLGADRYYVQFNGNTTSALYAYQIVESDCKYTTYRLHWLDKNGACESFNFNKKSTKENTIQRNKYKQIEGRLTSSSAYTYKTGVNPNRGTKTFYTEMKDTLKLKSDWLDDQENILLQSLVESSEIYLAIDEDGNQFVPVTCTDSKFITRTTLNDKCFALEINLELSYNRYSQRQ